MRAVTINCEFSLPRLRYARILSISPALAALHALAHHRIRAHARPHNALHSPVFFLFFVFFSSLTAVPSENQCLSSGAYEWPVLVSLKHAVGLSQHCFLLQEWLSKLMACSPTCELHSRHLGCGLELILAVYREVHAHSFILKCLLQWHVHAQHY